MKKILILGGIREAAELARQLVDEGHDVTTSLAGRTKNPDKVSGKVRIGGFGGVEGLARHLEENAIDLLIDCTHPFARNISANARQAASLAGTQLRVVERPPWQEQPGDCWNKVSSLEQACKAIPAGACVLLALGSQHIARFQTRRDVHFIVRMVDPPSTPLPLPDHELVLGKPAIDPQQERALLTSKKVTHIVCRNSGGKGAYAKISAARDLGLPVIMIER
jgi:precorrin-6A/cobalt-precorrin-6A reductase